MRRGETYEKKNIRNNKNKKHKNNKKKREEEGENKNDIIKVQQRVCFTKKKIAAVLQELR